MTEVITWNQLLSDKRVWLGPLGLSRNFKFFVDNDVPEIIEEYAGEKATFELWIEIQYRIAQALSEVSHSKQNVNTARALSGYADKEFFLMVHHTNEESYALQLRGLFYDEYANMQAGKITIGELYQKNPVSFFGPLLRKNEWVIN